MGVGDAGAGGFWAIWVGWIMEPRNTLNTRKGFGRIGEYPRGFIDAF